MDHLVVFIQHHDGASRDAGQRDYPLSRHHNSFMNSGPAHGGKCHHLIQPFDIAEAAHRKRQVSGDYQHHRIFHVAGLSR